MNEEVVGLSPYFVLLVELRNLLQREGKSASPKEQARDERTGAKSVAPTRIRFLAG